MKNGFQKLTAIFMTVLMFLAVIPVSAWGAEQYSNSVVPGISVLSILPGDTNTITYIFQKKNGEQTEEIARQIVKKGDTLLEPEVKTGENEKFTGWEPAVTFGTVGEITETKTITVTAKIEKVYYIFFKDNTGRVVATKECTDGQTVSNFDDATQAALSVIPLASDEGITGWKNAAGDEVTSVTLGKADVTLTAKIEKGYWITFESNGGSYIAPQFYAISETAAAPAQPTKPGYTFEGWYTDAGLTAKVTNFANIKATTTVYANWTPANTKYTVIHWQENADNDDYSYMESQTLYGNSGANTSARAKTYDGFTAQTIEQKTIMGDGSTIVSVYYKRNVYTITFYLDKPIYSCGKEEHTHSNWNGCYDWRGKLICTKEEHTHSSACGKVSQLEIKAKYGANISDQWPTVNGSNTWRTKESSGPYQVNIDTMPLGGKKFYGPKTGTGSETASYYVQVLDGENGDVTQNGVIYKLHHKDTSPGTGYSVTQEDKYALTGFTYKEGTANGQSYNNATFYYTRNIYNVVYLNPGDEGNTEIHKTAYQYEANISNAGEFKPTTPPAGKEGYVFDGWYADPLGEKKYDFGGKTMPAYNINVYAKWVSPVYTVTIYDADKATVLDTITDIPKGNTISEEDMPTVTVPDGSEFLGWVNMEDNKPFNFDTKITKNYSLYAKVGSKEGYTVAYNANGGAGAPTDLTKYAVGSGAVVQPKGDMTAPADDPDKAYFLGWAKTADAETPDYQPGETMEIVATDANAERVITLYAVWGPKPKTTTLTYNANFGETPAEKVCELENNATVTILDYGNAELGLPTRPGYEFLGWSENPNATEATYKAGDQIVVDETDATAKNILYAIWKQSVTSVKVAKQVTGNFGDKTREFKFEITFTDANGKALRLVQTDKAPTYSITSDTTVGGEKLTVLMKDKGEITLTNVPIGGTLVVTEIEASGYQTSYKIGETESQEGNVARYIVPENGGTITFINHRNVSPDTGVFVDSLPYILIIACVAGAAALFLIRRRKKRED